MESLIARRRIAFLGIIVLALPVVTACGTRVSRSAVIAALGSGRAATNGGSGANADATGSGSSGDQGSGAAGSQGLSSGASNGQSGLSATSGGSAAGGGAGGATASAGGAVTNSGGGASGGGGAATGGGGGSAVRLANLSPITIGNIGDYAGAPGQSLAPGAPMSLVVTKWINTHGGLNGHPIKMITADAGADPTRYVTLAKDMVENQHVVAFMANMVELSAPGADGYLTQKGVPVVGGGGAHSLWCQSPNMFFAGPCLKWIAFGDASFAAQQGKPKVALLFCGEAEPCRAFNDAWTLPELTPRTTAQLVYKAQVSLAQPDFTSECLQAQNHGAQALAMALDAGSLERAARSCLQQGYRPMFMTGSVALIAGLSKDPATDGIASAIPVFPWTANDLPAEKDYHAAVQQYAPGIDAGATTAATWLAGAVLQTAAANLPATNPGSADILNGLWSIKNNNFGGLAPAPITFTRGQPSPNPSCYFMIQNMHGTWVAPNGSKPYCL